MLPVKGFQVWGQEQAGHRVAGADDQGAQQQLLGLGELVLSGGDESQSAADVLVEHPALTGEGDAPGTAGEEPGLEGRLQLLDGLAHRRLGDVEIFGRLGDVAGLGDLFEDAVEFQLYCHGGPPLVSPDGGGGA